MNALAWPSGLSESELKALITDIDRDLARFALKYNERLYPPAELARLRSVFSSSPTVPPQDIEAALVWKFGHTGKSGYPTHHRALALRIAGYWSSSPMNPAQEPASEFRVWHGLLGQGSFVTVCFLLHLVHWEDLPIIDQHCYRSVCFHVMRFFPSLKVKCRPSAFEDLLLVSDFTALVLCHWDRYAVSARPSREMLDRYLMQHGKSLKPRRRRLVVS